MKLTTEKWKESGRTMVFIDSANIIHSCKSLGWKIGYKALIFSCILTILESIGNCRHKITKLRLREAMDELPT